MLLTTFDAIGINHTSLRGHKQQGMFLGRERSLKLLIMDRENKV